MGKNILRDKMSGGTKRPEEQNVWRQKDQLDKMSVGKKIRREKENVQQGKVPFDQWEN
jgi:hypothetical protein